MVLVGTDSVCNISGMVEVSGFLDETVERIFYFKVINEIVVGIYDLFLDLALLAIRPEVFKIGI